MSLPQSRAMVPALDRQLREYRAIAAQSQAYARAHGRRELRGPGTAALAMSAAMLRAQSMLDPSTSRLAERMIQGSTMGAVQMTRRLHQLTGRADPALVELGQRLLRTEEQNIQEMKRFLLNHTRGGPEAIRLRPAAAHLSTEKQNRVSCRYSAPARSTGLGNSGWWTASGKNWVSRQKPHRLP